MLYREWHDAMVACAEYAAINSPDPATQNAAVIYGATGICRSTIAVNRFPAGVEESTERWTRPLKYSYVEHAERNAIYAAAVQGISTAGATMVSPWAACADCARGIIQSGITRLVTMEALEARVHEGWDEMMTVGLGMLHEAGVQVCYVAGPLGIKVRRDGKVIEI